MALVWMDGFDAYATSTQLSYSGWIIESGTTTTLETGRDGGQCLRFKGADKQTYRAIPVSSYVIVGFAYQISNLSYLADLLNFYSDSLVLQAKVRINIDGSITLYRGTSTSLASSASGVITTGQWYYIETYFYGHDSSGVFTVYVNGTQVVTYAGDTLQSGGASLGAIMLSTNVADVTTTHDYDDFYVLDETTSFNNNVLGNCYIKTLRPIADVSTTHTAVPASATNYTQVNTSTISSATYVQGNASGLIDLYKVDASVLIANSSTIFGIQPTAFAQHISAGDRQIRTLAQASGVASTLKSDYFGLVDSNQTAAIGAFQYYPNSSSLWTAQQIASSAFGFEIK